MLLFLPLAQDGAKQSDVPAPVHKAAASFIISVKFLKTLTQCFRLVLSGSPDLV